MPALSTLAIFLLAALGLVFVPGPAVLFVLTRSVDQGRRAGAISALGIGAADLVHTTAAALGLSALLLASALAFSVVKYLGAAYLIYLGVRTLLRREAGQHTDRTEPQPPLRMFFQGLLVEIFNPKAALFFFAFLPQFVDPAIGPVALQVLLFGSLFVVLGLCSLGIYIFLAGTIAKWLSRSARFRQIRRYITGSIYIGLGVTAAFTGQHKK